MGCLVLPVHVTGSGSVVMCVLCVSDISELAFYRNVHIICITKYLFLSTLI